MARQTIELLQRDTAKFIPPDFWPPNNSDLNPVDYRTWGMMHGLKKLFHGIIFSASMLDF